MNIKRCFGTAVIKMRDKFLKISYIKFSEYLQGVSGGIVNILGGGSMEYPPPRHYTTHSGWVT